MHVALMSNIKQKAVSARVKDTMNCNRKLDNPKIGGKMTAGLGNTFNQKRPQLFAQLWKIGRSKHFEICG